MNGIIEILKNIKFEECRVMNFKNKTALITGASVGIGRAVALKLAEAGANMVLADINFEKLESVKCETEKFGAKTLIFKCDISDEQSVNDVVAGSAEKFGNIDILINNAAIWRFSKEFVAMTSEDWFKFININIMGAVYFSHACLPGMIENNYGRIVNVSSVAGVYGNRNMTAYSTTKGAINSLSKALAKEVADKGITVNSVCPGSVSSSDDPDVNSYQPSELAYIGRTGTDMENANLICFLASEEASYISGQVIQIDGCRKKL